MYNVYIRPLVFELYVEGGTKLRIGKRPRRSLSDDWNVSQTYQHALSDLQTKGMISELVTIEIGALGHWLPYTRSSLQQQVSLLSKSATTHVLDSAAKAIVTASHEIFCACLNPSWNVSQPFC